MPDSMTFDQHNSLYMLFMKTMESGGPVMFILLAMSITGMTVFLMKLFQFYFAGLHSFTAIEQAIDAWRERQWQAAQMHLTKTRNPAGNIIATIMRGQQNKQPQEMLREEVQRLASRVIAGLQSHLRIIEVIASLSPLLGLFGTVLGIIDAFHQLELAGNNVDVGQLSGGIWVALLTTAAGLAVGIPAVMAINWLEARVERFGRQTEDVVTLMFTYPLYANTEQTEEMTCSSARLASQGA